MGSGQSVRATHFQHPKAEDSEVDPMEEMPDDRHISISNKMVERLVEDATLVGVTGGVAASPRGDYKDKVYMERLRCMDESHSERTGLTVEDVNSLTNRIELRTANMVSVDPVCAECKEKVIECYNNYEQPEDTFKCWDTFTACVQSAGAARLRARTVRDAREHARRSRHVAHAREHELRDLAPRDGSDGVTS